MARTSRAIATPVIGWKVAGRGSPPANAAGMRGSSYNAWMAGSRHHAPATARNREPIRQVLERVLPLHGTVLEIASGSGEHAIHFARAFPGLTWQPSDASEPALASIAAWLAEVGLPNLRAPIALDVTAAAWPVVHADAIVCINMVHIAPWQAALGLFDGAARLLSPGAPLYLYGPYRFGGRFTAASNAEFDRGLRQRDPRWGVRDVDELSAAAGVHGFALEEIVEMPANNHSLVFRAGACAPPGLPEPT
jgi:SAM-dependent methyltransferase